MPRSKDSLKSVLRAKSAVVWSFSGYRLLRIIERQTDIGVNIIAAPKHGVLETVSLAVLTSQRMGGCDYGVAAHDGHFHA